MPWSDPGRTPMLVLLTDGKANISMAGGDPFDEALDLMEALEREGLVDVTVNVASIEWIEGDDRLANHQNMAVALTNLIELTGSLSIIATANHWWIDAAAAGPPDRVRTSFIPRERAKRSSRSLSRSSWRSCFVRLKPRRS